MRYTLIILLMVLPVMVFSQNGITFQVEELKRPEELLRLTSSNDIFRELILQDEDMSEYDLTKQNIDFPFNIYAKCALPDSLVSYGYHSFFNGMYQAYANHRPFVLSPDMIWLLISQGFARHVNNNAEELRSYFVDFTGKETLVVVNDSVPLDDPNSPWESVFPEFTKQIGKRTGEELMNVLSCNFSTTSPTTKVASEITIMEAMKPYFEYVVFYSVCGIPEITLEGTTDDWQKILDKARFLRKYKLDWWMDEIEPLLKEFVKASKGSVNKKFWRNMFKYHSKKYYGAPKIIDGWIVKFFPYDKDGQRNKLKEIAYRNDLPNEIVKVDLKYTKVFNTGASEVVPLELWAGFVGLDQNPVTFSLKPRIGWMIRKKDVENKARLEKFESDNSSDWGRIMIRVKKFPEELLKLDRIKNLNIDFMDSIDIPDEIRNIKIDILTLTGKISESGIERIHKLLPQTELHINENPFEFLKKKK